MKEQFPLNRSGKSRLAAFREIGVTLSGVSVTKSSFFPGLAFAGTAAAWAVLDQRAVHEPKNLKAEQAPAIFVERFLAPANAHDQTDENEVPPASVVVVSVPGDIWQLGPHRIACGDSTDVRLVKALLAGAIPQLMVTDPPYGVEYDPEWRHRMGVNKSQKRGKIQNDGRADWAETWALFPGQIAYVWHGALHAGTVAESLVRTGFTIRSQIVWAKERLVMSRGDYHWQHEPCWYAVRKKGNWTGDRKQTTLWSIPTGGQDVETKHSTQKPVECMRRPILNNSDPGQAVYEPFIDVVIRRWQAFTGESAIRVGDGRSFQEAACAIGIASPASYVAEVP